ncbi:MAG TPA: PAS domain-containing protein [Spirochaetia bacterium]|nr:PAS domain-containing protein [Spirochaetia bacterium]
MGMNLDADDLQEIVALCDEQGVILSWNAAAEQITGFRRDDVVGYHVDSVIAPASQAELQAIFTIGRTGSILPGLSIWLQSTFGMEIPTELVSVPQYAEGKLSGWLLIFRDTTLKVQLQQQLDRMDVLYRGLVEHSPAIIYVLDSQGRTVFINDTVETLLGYSKKELLGRELIEIVHPDDRQFAYWPLRERRRSMRATRNLQVRLTTKAGAHRQYDLDFIYVALDAFGLGPAVSEPGEAKQHGGAADGTQGVARDVTELVMLRDFSRQVGLILPLCSVCRRIRVTQGTKEEWLPLHDYVARRTGILFSHTYCPDHAPA